VEDVNINRCVQSNGPSRKRRRMTSDVIDIPHHVAKYDIVDDGVPHITRCPPSFAVHWASAGSDTFARNRRGSVICRCVAYVGRDVFFGGIGRYDITKLLDWQHNPSQCVSPL